MQVVGFLNLVLFVTNIWVFIYNTSLQILNTHFPSVVPEQFIRSGAVPEPFEIPLYLIFSFVAFIFIWFLQYVRSVKNSNAISAPFLKGSVLFFLLLLLINNLGIYPMGRSSYPYEKGASASEYTYFYFIYIFLAAAITSFAVFGSFYFKKNKIKLLLFFGFIISLIALATFEPQFPITGHDYAHFFGPIWEIAHGNTIFTQVPSQYGFLSVLFFATLFKINLLNIAYLPAFVWFFYIIQFFLCFYLVYRVSRSLPIATMCLLSIITVNYFSIYHLPATFPQIGPLRWLPLIASLAVLLSIQNLTSKRFIAFLSIACFWVLDSGIALLMAYGYTLFLLCVTRRITLKAFIKSIFLLFLHISLFFISLNILHVLFGYQPIVVGSIFAKLKEYGSAGFGMIPIDSFSYFWVAILIYVASITYFFQRKHPVFYDQFVLYAANLSLFACVYFVGRSHPHNLYHIALFPILNIFLLVGLSIKQIHSRKHTFIIGILLFVLFIAYPIYNRQEVMTLMVKEKIQRFNSGHIFEPEWLRIIANKYSKEKEMIQREIPDDKIVILSHDDTYLFYYLNKNSLIHDNPHFTILTEKGMNSSLVDVFKSCPHKIVGDCTLFGKCSQNETFVGFAMITIEPLLLSKIQDGCRVTYAPTTCTSQLCIAESHPK